MASESPSAPELSAVVTVVEGVDALARCLEALERQEDSPTLEVLIPYDNTIAAVGRLAERFPNFRFMNLGRLASPDAAANPFTEHELFDKRRSAGLAAARGRLVAMLEDRGAPRADWARLMIEEQARHDAAVIGGAVVNVAPGVVNRALFVADYGRYQPPLGGPAEYLTDINLVYTKVALDSVREVWAERYLEAAVNWALRDRGERLILTDKPVVLHLRGSAPLRRILSERLQWGRIYGITRARYWSKGRAAASALAALVLPLLLLVRHVRGMKAKGYGLGAILGAIPALALILPVWALGEAIGYIQGASKPDLLAPLPA